MKTFAAFNKALVVACLAVVVVACEFILPLAPAGAVAIGGGSAFAITPVPAKDGLPRDYFKFSVGSGATATDSVVVSNLSHHGENLKIGVASGTTAPNSGSAYEGAYKSCQSSACWVSGVPQFLSLGAGSSKTLTFRIAVPPGTSQGQYLAGISVELANPPAAVSVGSNGNSSAKAVIINEATVGVAVTVGSLSQLTSQLVVTGVNGASFEGVPRLDVSIKNIGQTFAHGAGSATCAAKDRTLSFPVLVNTVLPGDSATIAVNAVGLTAATLEQCHISVPFGAGVAAEWSGHVTIPSTAAVRLYHPKRGVYESVPSPVLATWIKVLIGVAGVLVLALIVLLSVIVRHRRKAAKLAREHVVAPMPEV